MSRRAGRLAGAGIALGILAPFSIPQDVVVAADKQTTPIGHFVTLMQENHTFDNYFGTYPGADGIPPDTCMPRDPALSGDCVRPFRMDDRPALDLGHTGGTFAGQYRDGAMDGFIAAQDGVDTVMGYYDGEDLPYYWNLADEFALLDRFFSSSGGGSLINHVYWIAGDPGPTPDTIPPDGLEMETIFDRLENAEVSWKVYIQNYDPGITFRNLVGNGDRASQVIWAPVLAMPRFIDTPSLSRHIVDLDEYFADLNNGTLPAVSYIVPSGSSEHPPGSLTSGQRFVQTLISSLVRSTAWADSAFLLAYDDWGGWYDHVPPPQVDTFGYGFRVPAVLVSPFAKRGHIDHTERDFTSILRFIEDNWSLEPLSRRDAVANGFESAFDFTKPGRAPFFVRSERALDPARAEPNRAVLYMAYAASIGLALLLVVTALFVERRKRAATW